MAFPYRETVSDTGQTFIAGDSVESESTLNKARWTQYLDNAIFAFLALFAILLPHSIKGAERSWKIALVLWLVKIVIARARPFRQPLVLPLLFYAVLSAISTILSPEPYLSWDRMKMVCLLLAGIVVAQNLKRLSQVRWLVALLVLSGLSAALFTAWQYTYGIGVRLAALPPATRLEQVGFRPNDTITAVAGRAVHTPQQLVRELQNLPPSGRVSIRYMPYMISRADSLVATPNDFLASGLGTPAMQLVRGRPDRAQGTLGHYVVFAEMLMQISCLGWALLLGTGPGLRRTKVALAVISLSIIAALIAAETRAALVGLALGCLVALPLLDKRRVRLSVAALLLALGATGTYWIVHARGLNWTSSNDLGTQFRLVAWHDALHLIRQHPWFGVGMETVRVHWREWGIRSFAQFHVVGHFHSTLLQIAVERGLLTLAAWIWFVVAYCVFLFRLIGKSRERSRFATAVVTGILAGFVAFLTTSLVHYNLGEEPLVMLLFFFFGIAIAIDHLLTIPTAIDVA